MNELEPILLPNRSRLYSLEPMGIGSGMVESLASYLRRLADVHMVSVPDLMMCMTPSPTRETGDRDHRTYNLMGLRSRQLNEMRQIAQRWSTLVASHTCRQGIEGLTLLPWSQLLTPRALLRASQYWCPHCLNDGLESGQPLYWPLLWSLQSVIVCPIHQVRLEQRCHDCYSTVPSLTAYSQIGYCPKCNAWLGVGERSASTAQPVEPVAGVTKNSLNIAQGALALLAVSSSIQERVHIVKLVALLEYCRHSVNCRQVALANHLGVSEPALYRLIYRQTHVTVPLLINILTSLGLDIADFIQKPVTSLVSSGYLNNFIDTLPGKRRSILQSRLIPGQRATPELLADVQSTLETALAEDDPPPLTVLARRVGLTTVKILHSHYPHLCQAIIDKKKSRYNLEVTGQVLAEILDSASTPPPLMTIAVQLKTSTVTLRKYFPEQVATIKARRCIIRDVEELRRNVSTFLDVDPPLSFAEISRHLGLKTHHLRQHCPNLQQAIVQRFATYQHSCGVERQRKSIETVRHIVAELNANGQFPTKSKVAAALGKTGRLILSKTESEAFTQMMHELGLQQR